MGEDGKDGAILMKRFENEAIPQMDSLYRSARRLTGNDKDAEDLLQEMYLRAFRSFHQYEENTNIRAWLYRIMMNLHINRYQKASKEPLRISYDDTEDFYLYNKMIADPSTRESYDMEGEILDRILDEEVRRAIEKLPFEFRATVILADIEGFKYQEIAEILDCPIGTVRSRLSRGRKILEKLLWDYAKQRDYIKEYSREETV